MNAGVERTILSAGVGVANGEIPSEELGLPAGGRITTRILHGGKQEGVVEVIIDTGSMRISLLPTRGMGIWWAQFRGKDLFWKSPVHEAVHPMYVNLERNGGLGWLDGFCEGLVRCGLAFNGAPGKDQIIDDRGETVSVDLPLHGLIANIPASEVTVAGIHRGKKAILSVTGVFHETTAQFDKYRLITRTEVELGGARIDIHDEVTNLSAERTQPLELLYHINVGGAALAEGSRMIAQGHVAPRDERAAQGLHEHASFGERTRGFTEQCYFMDLAADPNGRTGAMLVNPAGDFAVYELHNKDQLKCFTQWKQLGADEYVNGFEPGTSFPNCRGVEREAQRLEFLSPDQTRAFDLTVGALDAKETIAEMQKQLGG